MTPADYTAIERALTDEVLDTAYTQAGWLTAAHQFEKTGWAEVKQKKATVMRAVLLEAIRRALPAEGERTEFVWIVESGDYEQRTIKCACASPEAAEMWLTSHYSSPYRAQWEPRVDHDIDTSSITGHFEAVHGYSTQHTQEFDITRWPIQHAPTGEPERAE